MQGIEQIAYQNACVIAMSRAAEHQEPYCVIRNDLGNLDVVPQIQVDGREVVYTADVED